MPGVLQRAGGRGGFGNISGVKESVTPPSPNGLTQVKPKNTTATTVAARANVTHQSNSKGFSAKSLNTLPEEHITHPDYGDNIILPAGREVGLPRNKVRGSIHLFVLGPKLDHASVQTTTSGRGGAGNCHGHVLEEGLFERVIAYEDLVIQPYRETQALKNSRTTGRGGAGNVGRSTDNLSKDDCELYPSILLPSSPLFPPNDYLLLQRPPGGPAVQT